MIVSINVQMSAIQCLNMCVLKYFGNICIAFTLYKSKQFYAIPQFSSQHGAVCDFDCSHWQQQQPKGNRQLL